MARLAKDWRRACRPTSSPPTCRRAGWRSRRVGPRLDPGLEQMPRPFRVLQAPGPESLRRRDLLALPDFRRRLVVLFPQIEPSSEAVGGSHQWVSPII